jgi:anti-anti-sigma regulatory factor
MIDIQADKQSTLITVSGSFDFETSRDFLGRLSSKTISSSLTLDLSDCPTVDSSFLACLMKLQAMLKEHSLVITGCNDKVHHTLQVMNFSHLAH